MSRPNVLVLWVVPLHIPEGVALRSSDSHASVDNFDTEPSSQLNHPRPLGLEDVPIGTGESVAGKSRKSHRDTTDPE
jgi:hypothetical protein